MLDYTEWFKHGQPYAEPKNRVSPADLLETLEDDIGRLVRKRVRRYRRRARIWAILRWLFSPE